MIIWGKVVVVVVVAVLIMWRVVVRGVRALVVAETEKSAGVHESITKLERDSETDAGGAEEACVGETVREGGATAELTELVAHLLAHLTEGGHDERDEGGSFLQGVGVIDSMLLSFSGAEMIVEGTEEIRGRGLMDDGDIMMSDSMTATHDFDVRYALLAFGIIEVEGSRLEAGSEAGLRSDVRPFAHDVVVTEGAAGVAEKAAEHKVVEGHCLAAGALGRHGIGRREAKTVTDGEVEMLRREACGESACLLIEPKAAGGG